MILIIYILLQYTDEENISTDESSNDDENETDTLEVLEHNEPTNCLIPNEKNMEINRIQKWAVDAHISHTHLDGLLGILRERLIPNLPKSSKTFLGTSSAEYKIIEMEDNNGTMGEFVYFGIATGLQECINIDNHVNDLIELQIACDGLRLVDSGYQELWPTMCKIHFDPDIYKPFTVSVYFGQSKPKEASAYLEQFINEINFLHQCGLEIQGRYLRIKLKCFVCDTPARAFLKCTAGHTSFHACERCSVQGFKENRRTVYPSVVAKERTNKSFRQRLQPGHHNKETPLLRIYPFLNIISCFVLHFMHLCCEGVMKKLLEEWIKKGKNKLRRLERLELCRRMKMLKSQIPCEFQRKTRSTNRIAKWKATEFRFFYYIVV